METAKGVLFVALIIVSQLHSDHFKTTGYAINPKNRLTHVLYKSISMCLLYAIAVLILCTYGTWFS